MLPDMSCVLNNQGTICDHSGLCQMNHVIYGKSYVVLQTHAYLHSVCLSVCLCVVEYLNPC